MYIFIHLFSDISLHFEKVLGSGPEMEALLLFNNLIFVDKFEQGLSWIHPDLQPNVCYLYNNYYCFSMSFQLDVARGTIL